AYRRYDIPGRNIIDTWILAQHYDISSRELESLGLKQLAQHFGLARKDRVYIDASKISHYFEHEPDKLYEYALDAARETRALAELARSPRPSLPATSCRRRYFRTRTRARCCAGTRPRLTRSCCARTWPPGIRFPIRRPQRRSPAATP